MFGIKRDLRDYTGPRKKKKRVHMKNYETGMKNSC